MTALQHGEDVARAAPADTVLDVRGVRTRYRTRDGAVEAVRGVSFALRRGEKTALVGESGSGKSALALSILGLMRPPGQVVGGEVWLKGRDLRTLSEAEMCGVRGREISLVYQDPLTALDPIRTIGEQIVEALRCHRSDLDRAAARRLAVDLLRDVEVPSAERRLDDYPHQYSGGMRQRVVIAIALANEPDVLIADEPTTALDVTTQAQVLDLLDRLVTDRGTAVILITHNLGIVAGFCESASVMYAGRLVEQGPVDRLFARPGHPYTEALLRAVPRPGRTADRRLTAIAGLPPDLAKLPDGCAFEPRCPLGHGKELCRTADPALIETSDGAPRQAAACHFARERAAGEVPLPTLSPSEGAP